jgi:hypothetical protein|tara:strand:- start:86 stop:415 length:330 start_codon:yes stop_codon:yes gene_type:complete
MKLKRNRKDYGNNEMAIPHFLRVRCPKDNRWRILGWFPSIAATKRKAWSYTFKLKDGTCWQRYDQSNYGEEWEMKPAREVEDPKWPFGYTCFDPAYQPHYRHQSFLDGN